MNIGEYRIIDANNWQSLEKKVNELTNPPSSTTIKNQIVLRWMPVGCPFNDNGHYYQAVAVKSVLT